MFYTNNPDEAFRLGDIVTGFVLSTSCIKSPIATLSKLGHEYSIGVHFSGYSVILTPCCSIGDGVILLTPLVRIARKFFANPYLEEDMTRINSKMLPEQSVPPVQWEKMTQEEKTRRFDMSQRESYTFLDYFVYAPHDLLPQYSLDVLRRGKAESRGKVETGHYMIDFRKTCRVECKEIVNPKKVPLGAKVLQLTAESRQHLRDKFTYYFNRIPVEDSV
jgi:hypothetical protein